MYTYTSQVIPINVTQADKQTNRQTNGQKDEQTNKRQTNRHTARQTDKQTDKQTDRETVKRTGTLNIDGVTVELSWILYKRLLQWRIAYTYGCNAT